MYCPVFCTILQVFLYPHNIRILNGRKTNYIFTQNKAKKTKVSGFWSPRTSTSDLRISISSFLFLCYETMSNCGQNCWIDWNSAVLCFKQLFCLINARFVRPLLATVLCGKFGLVQINAYMCITHFTGWQKKYGRYRHKFIWARGEASYNDFFWSISFQKYLLISFRNLFYQRSEKNTQTKFRKLLVKCEQTQAIWYIFKIN